MTDISKILKPRGKVLKHIVLSEGADPRVIDAAETAKKQGLAQISLIGGDGINPADHPNFGTYIARYTAARAAKGMTLDKAHIELLEPSFFAAAMVEAGDADGTIGGAVYATPDIIRAALRVIGVAPDTPILSSFFLILFQGRDDLPSNINIFSDSGLVIDPTAEEMAEIAIASAGSMTSLTGQDPKIAMLSFSTHGSAKHPNVTKVAQATELVRQKRPDLAVDGELQFDAAMVPAVGQAKAPGSDVAGYANTFIFPNLDAGNIGYKIAQRFGGARAIGPILQGLKKPANDLSRGCSAQDIVDMIAVTVAQAEGLDE